MPQFMSLVKRGHVAVMQSVRTTGVLALLKYRFCPKMDADMATNVIATVNIVSACKQKRLFLVEGRCGRDSSCRMVSDTA